MADVREITDPKTWNDFVDSSPQGTIFSTTRWMSLYDEMPKLYGYYKNGNLVGGAANFSKPMPVTPFQGILVEPKEAKYTSICSLHNEVATALLDVLPDKFCNHYTFPDIRSFLWKGWQAYIRYTYVLSLRELMIGHKENIWGNLEKQTRYEIIKTGSDIYPVESDDIQFFDALYEQTFSRKGMTRPVSTEYIYKFWNTIKPRLYLASDNSSAVIMVLDAKRAYYMFGASDGSGSSSRVLWGAFQDLASMKVPEVDMGGCNDYNIAQFKKGFGGKLIPYYGVMRRV